MIASTDQLVREHIAWLESLQDKRRQHLEKLTALVAKKQLEIDNFKQMASAYQAEV